MKQFTEFSDTFWIQFVFLAATEYSTSEIRSYQNRNFAAYVPNEHFTYMHSDSLSKPVYCQSDTFESYNIYRYRQQE
jgi:hypothetical protein